MVLYLVNLIRRVIGTKHLISTVSSTQQLMLEHNELDKKLAIESENKLTIQLVELEKRLAIQLIELEEKLAAKKSTEPVVYTPLKAGEKLRVVFLFQVSSLWPSWKSFWEACVQDDHFDAKLVLTERIGLNAKLHFLNEARNFLIENCLPFIVSSAFSLEQYRPHVVFVQTPYSETLPSKYAIERLQLLGCRLAYIPYGLEIGGGAVNLRYQFNLPVHQLAWRIFARSKRHLYMYAKYCSTGFAHVVPIGHPKMDSYRKLDTIKIEPQLLEKVRGRKTILWCPHFSILKDQWSTFLSYYEYILNYFSNCQELFLIVRPHPLLFSGLRDQLQWGDEEITNFKKRIAVMPNAYLDVASDYLASFKVSHAILADAGSFLLEYFSTEKPVAYLHNSQGPGLNDDGDIIKHFYVINDKHDIDAFLTMMINNQDPKKEQRIGVIADYLQQNPQGIGVAIKDYILKAVYQYDYPVTVTNKMDEKHQEAENYWRAATTTYLAAPEYYDRQEVAMKELLNKLGVIDSALDVGCGDGRFTKLISQYVKHTRGIDVSSELIAKAKNNLNSESVDLVVESVTESHTCHRYDLISCMGVTSGLIDDEIFLRTVDVLVSSCKPGGYLLMKDSLSLCAQQNTLPNQQGYVAVYRNMNDYLNCFLSRKCKLVEQYELFSDGGCQLVNKLFLFTVPTIN